MIFLRWASPLLFTACLFDTAQPPPPRTNFDFTLLEQVENPFTPWHAIAPEKTVMGLKFAFHSMNYAWEVDSNIAAYAAETGHVPAAVGAYFDLSSQPRNLGTFLDAVRRHGSIPFVTLDPKDWDEPDIAYQRTFITLIQQGRFDDSLKALAQTLRVFGNPVLFRFAHEMNGNWYPYSGAFIGGGGDANTNGQPDGPENYIRAWRRVHDLFRAEGVTNLVWMFCPNSENFPPSDWNRPFRYYPGSDYVDLISVDGYESPDKSRRNLSAILNEFYNELGLHFETSGDALRPFGLGEFGTYRPDRADKTQWYSDALSYIAEDPRIKFAAIYNDRNYSRDFSIKGLGPELQTGFSSSRFQFAPLPGL